MKRQGSPALLLLASVLFGSMQNAHGGIEDRIQEFKDWWSKHVLGAIDFGYWSCSNCIVPPPDSSPSNAAPADADTWIKANNSYIFESLGLKNPGQQIIPRWTPGSTITLCNSGNSCYQLIYQTGCGCWLPKTGGFNLPPGKTPKVPPQPASPASTTPASFMEIGFIGPTPTVNGTLYFTLPPKILVPSVTVIERGQVNEYQGAASDLSQLNDAIGDQLDWSSEAAPLGPSGGGGGGGGGGRDGGFQPVLE